MIGKRFVLGILLLLPALVKATNFTLAAEFPLQKHLESAGLQVAYETPEEATLLLNLPKIYIFPDSPFYFLKKLLEGAQLILTTEPERRGEILLTLAEKRLAEAVSLIKKGDWGEATATLQNYQGQFENAQNMLNLIQDIKDYEKLRQQIFRQLQNQVLLTAFLEKIGAGEMMGGFQPKVQNGQLELKPIE